MKAKGVVWVGSRTGEFDRTVAFFRDALELDLVRREESVAVLDFPNGDRLEIFGESDREHVFFSTGPVVEFLVDDVPAARTELEARGVEFLSPVKSEGGYTWTHFRGPDGNVYGITSRA